MRAAGATLFTASAATGTGLAGAASGGGNLAGLLGGGSVLGNVLSGAIKQGLVGGLIGGIAGSLTGAGFGKGALIGGLGGAALGGFQGFATPTGISAGVDTMTTGSTSPLVAANTATGAAPNISYGGPGEGASKFGGTGLGTPTAITAATTGGTQQGGGLFKGLGGFLGSEGGAAMIGGIGEALASEREWEQVGKIKEDERKFLREQEQRITDSYAVDPTVLGGTYVDPERASRPTPGQKWVYNRNSGMIERAA